MARRHHRPKEEEEGGGGIIRRHHRHRLLITSNSSSHLHPVWCCRHCSHRHRAGYSASEAVLVVEAVVVASSRPRVPMDIHHRQRHMVMRVMHRHLMDILMDLRKVRSIWMHLTCVLHVICVLCSLVCIDRRLIYEYIFTQYFVVDDIISYMRQLKLWCAIIGLHENER